ncbi:putative amidohydrolase [Haloactinospora alba]|uniref:Putative amidohydrolase n=1 Tax=Haloactinospora alba TaxID=405555 RepID=A0A543NNL8_9ACTN|nr:carbon-nitrogen hydrolase family protein [Haloactinospora alba]TQN33429.1 putative amidohydrolase [Haloactinospora alba]
MAHIRIACLQSAGHPADVEANLTELDRAAARAAGQGADLLITPELFLTGYDIGDAVLRLAGEPLAARAGELARRHDLALLAGLPERSGPGLANRAVFVRADGAVAARYTKTHLFGELDQRYFRAGEQALVLVELHGVRIAPLICYDVEFPEAARAAALAGAHLVAVPTAQMRPFTFVAETVIPARAWENQLYLAYANRVGAEGDTHYVGRSSVAAPTGELLASSREEPALLLADVDTDTVARGQRDNPYLHDRRPDLYDSLTRTDR